MWIAERFLPAFCPQVTRVRSPSIATIASAVDAALERVVLAAAVVIAEQYAIIPDSFRDILEVCPLSAEHEIDGLDQEGLAGVAGTPEDVQSWRERELGGFFAPGRETG